MIKLTEEQKSACIGKQFMRAAMDISGSDLYELDDVLKQFRGWANDGVLHIDGRTITGWSAIAQHEPIDEDPQVTDEEPHEEEEVIASHEPDIEPEPEPIAVPDTPDEADIPVAYRTSLNVTGIDRKSWEGLDIPDMYRTLVRDTHPPSIREKDLAFQISRAIQVCEREARPATVEELSEICVESTDDIQSELGRMLRNGTLISDVTGAYGFSEDITPPTFTPEPHSEVVNG